MSAWPAPPTPPTPPKSLFTLHPNPVSWTTRDTLLFAVSISSPHTPALPRFTSELAPNFTPFPTYPLALTFKHTHTSTIPFSSHFDTFINPPLPPPTPRFDSSRVVDGGRSLTVYHPLPASSDSRPNEKFEIVSHVTDIADKGKGKPGIVEVEHWIQSRTSPETPAKLYAVITETAVYLNQGGWGGPRGSLIRETVDVPEGKKPDFVWREQVPINAHLLYRLNGDYNPLHVEHEAGVKAGFGGVIMHGLYLWNCVARGIVERIVGERATRGDNEGEMVLRRFEGRFKSPVRPGDGVEVKVWVIGEQDGWTEVRWRAWVRSQGEEKERLALEGGRAVVKGVWRGEVKAKI